jgi:hypothetical protein
MYKDEDRRCGAFGPVNIELLDIAIISEPVPSELPLGYRLEPCPLEVIGPKTTFGCRALLWHKFRFVLDSPLEGRQ